MKAPLDVWGQACTDKISERGKRFWCPVCGFTILLGPRCPVHRVVPRSRLLEKTDLGVACTCDHALSEHWLLGGCSRDGCECEGALSP